MKLRDWRRLRGFTQKQAAEHIGTSQPSIAKCETGCVPSAELMKKIIRGTEGAVTANDFFDLAGLTSSAEQRNDPKPIAEVAA